MNRAELRARYPFPRFPASWSVPQRRAFWVLSALWLTAWLVVPAALIENESVTFFVSWWGFYLWLWFFPWRWSIAQGSAGEQAAVPPR